MGIALQLDEYPLKIISKNTVLSGGMCDMKQF